VLWLVPAGALGQLAARRATLGGRMPDLRTATSWVSLAVLAILVVAGWLGSRDPLSNPLPLVVWTLFWIGLTMATGVFGNLFDWLDPWRGPARLFGRAGERPAPAWLGQLGYGPAIVQFAAFAWFELVYPAPDDPARLAWAVSIYWLVNFAGVLAVGREPWTRRCEPFSVFFRIVSKLAILERSEGGLRLCLPGGKLAGAEPLPLSGALFLLLVLGSVSFDGLMRTFAWLGTIGVNPLEFPGRSAVMVGGSPNMVFAVTDAIYAPLAAKQLVRARQADMQAARNNSLLAVAEAYFNVQQARGEVAGSADAVRRAEDLVRRVEKLAEGLTPAVEKNRALTELARRRQGVELAYERWQTASAELHRLLRLDPSALAVPVEAPNLRVDLIDLHRPVDELIPLALTCRPELAAQQAVVQATLARLKQEKIRPLVPSVVIRGAATNPAGTLAGGYFGGGRNSNLSNFGARNSIDFQLLWEFQNLGLGNRALVRQRDAESQQATLTLFQTQDRVAAEVAQAYAQATRAVRRLREAEEEVKNAAITVEKNLEGLQQTRNVGGVLLLVFRPQEVVAAIQQLDQAYRSFYGATADANRAQFRLYRALGQPAQYLAEQESACAGETQSAGEEDAAK